MRKGISYAVTMLIFALLATPFFAFAANSGIHSNVFDITILKGPLLVCTGAGGDSNIPSVCQNLCDLIAQIANIIYFMIAVVIWIVAPIMFALAGIFYMLAGANPGMLERAKKTLTGTVWGVIIVLCAWLIVFIFISAVGNLSQYVGGFGGSSGNISCDVSS